MQTISGSCLDASISASRMGTIYNGQIASVHNSETAIAADMGLLHSVCVAMPLNAIVAISILFYQVTVLSRLYEQAHIIAHSIQRH